MRAAAAGGRWGLPHALVIVTALATAAAAQPAARLVQRDRPFRIEHQFRLISTTGQPLSLPTAQQVAEFQQRRGAGADLGGLVVPGFRHFLHVTAESWGTQVSTRPAPAIRSAEPIRLRSGGEAPVRSPEPSRAAAASPVPAGTTQASSPPPSASRVGSIWFLTGPPGVADSAFDVRGPDRISETDGILDAGGRRYVLPLRFAVPTGNRVSIRESLGVVVPAVAEKGEYVGASATSWFDTDVRLESVPYEGGAAAALVGRIGSGGSTRVGDRGGGAYAFAHGTLQLLAGSSLRTGVIEWTPRLIGSVQQEERAALTIASCGDGRCDANETMSNCCTDCGCPPGQQCVDNVCVTPAAVPTPPPPPRVRDPVRIEIVDASGRVLRGETILSVDVIGGGDYDFAENGSFRVGRRGKVQLDIRVGGSFTSLNGTLRVAVKDGAVVAAAGTGSFAGAAAPSPGPGGTTVGRLPKLRVPYSLPALQRGQHYRFTMSGAGEDNRKWLLR